MTDIANLVSPSTGSFPPPPPLPPPPPPPSVQPHPSATPSTSHAYDPMRDTETGEAPAIGGSSHSDSSDSRDGSSSSQGRAHDADTPLPPTTATATTTTATTTATSNDPESSGISSAGNPDATLVQTLTKRAPPPCMTNSKIKHLKKADGIPLWRADIQYDFLYAVFHDEKAVFTNSYDGKTGQTFADVYVDAMARSSKTSKILRDKLMTERANALNMAMVCLLVNLGRMNTTLNFFPEMKAQLRTYHAIPSLQAHSDSNAYKQLQDAPRLKSILKGACEDRKEPQTLDQIMEAPIPRTNPINLVFVLSTYAPRITEVNFPDNIDFHDLVMRPTLSSKSRARAFLWLMWFYLEGKLDAESCKMNPFGEGRAKPGETLPCRVPEFEFLTEDQAALENVDTEFEKEFGEEKQRERKRLIGDQSNAPPGTGRGRGNRKSTNFAGTPDAGSPSGSPPPSYKRKLQPRYGHNDGSFDFESEPPTRSGSPDSFSTPYNAANRSASSIRRLPLPTNKLSTPGAFDTLSPMEIRSKGGPGSVASTTTKRNTSGGGSKRTIDGDIKSAPHHSFRNSKHHQHQPLVAPNFFASRVHHTPLPRPVGARLTQHQIMLQKTRDDIIDHIIFRKLTRLDKKRRKTRRRTGAIARAWERIRDIEDPLMQSDDETGVGVDGLSNHHDDDDHHHHTPTTTGKKRKSMHDKLGYQSAAAEKAGLGEKIPKHPAGVVGRREEEGKEGDDFGEEAMAMAAAIRRMTRRLDRWGKEERRRELIRDQGGEGAGGDDVDEKEAVPMQRGESDATVDDPEMGADVDDDEDEDMAGVEAHVPVVKAEEGLGEVAMGGM